MKVDIVNTDMSNVRQYGLCGYKDIKRAGFPEKIDWLKDRLNEGLTIKTLVSDEDGAQGMIEYIPGEYCWRPVEAAGWLFIHCIFVGFKKKYQGQGYGTLLLRECIADAVKGNYKGVAVVTRKGSFMAGNNLFLKNGFEVVDTAVPDFSLMIKRLNSPAAPPRFRPDIGKQASRYGEGLTIIRAFQCPYTVKNVNEIAEVAEKTYGLKPDIITLSSAEEAWNSPCAYGIFCILYNGKIVATQPISRGRFTNIMKKETGQ